MKEDVTDLAWAKWDEVLRSITFHMKRNDLSSGIKEINEFLSGETVPEVRSSALGMKAHFEQGLGDLAAAKQDLLSACSLVGPSFGRYVHELSLADIQRKQGRTDEARAWCRAALHTCELAGISGGGALKTFMELQTDEPVYDEDRKLLSVVAERSWRILALPGTPDLTDLGAVTNAIRTAEAAHPKARAKQ